MPTDLAALLVEEGAVSPGDLARAEERRREAGGALDTALLELGLVDEFTLVGALSRASGLPPAPSSAWESADPRARRVFPSRVAERHGLAPFALDGRELSLVATYPVDVGLLDEISFMLSLHLTAHVGPEWRVRALIHRLYGGALEPRAAALAEGRTLAPSAAGAAPGPEPGLEPGAAGGPAPAPGRPAGEDVDLSFSVDEDVDLGAQEPSAAESSPATEAPPAADRGFARDASEPLEPLAAALARALESDEFRWLEEAVEEEEVRGAGGAAEVAAAEAAAGEGPAAEPEPAPEPEPPPRPIDRTAPPRWSLDEAREALADARTRDEVVVAALRHARDAFEFAAFFVVTRDVVAGHDALGRTDDARELCRSVAFYTADPGTFHTVIDTRSPYLGPIDRDVPANAAVLDGLVRGSPRTALVYPVQLRERTVAVLYADNGEAPVSPQRAGDVVLLLGTVGATFARILRERKTRRRARRPALKPAARPEPEAPVPTPPPGALSPVAPGEGWQVTEPARTPAPMVPPPPAPATPEAEPHREPAAEARRDVAEPPAPAAPVALGEQDVELEPEPPAAAPPAAEDAGIDAAVESLVASAPDSAERAAALAAVLRRPDEAIPALVARLPGPADPAGGGAEGAPGPVSAALVAFGGPAVPALLAALGDADPARRRAAALLLGAAGDPVAFGPLAERALDPDPAVATAAAHALGAHRRHPAIRPIPEKLRRALLSGIAARATGAARALGALRDVEAIPLLVQVLETPDREAAEASADALSAITLQRLGTDARRWLTWWKENRGRGRAEWLFRGLGHADREVRVAAAAELAEAAPPPVAWSADAPAGEREAAARAWAGWWARSGRVL